MGCVILSGGENRRLSCIMCIITMTGCFGGE